jgi:hypothetical protein
MTVIISFNLLLAQALKALILFYCQMSGLAFCLQLNILPETGNSLQKTGARGIGTPNFGVVSLK